MIVNHSHKFIFVHVPKAAGTSVSELFSKFSAYSDLEVGGTELGEALQNAYKRRFGLTKHSTADEIRAVVGAGDWGDYYSFAFVRDPYARAQSTFHFMKRWHGNKEMKQLSFMDDYAEFRDFVMSDTFAAQKAHRLLWPQAKWLTDAKGRISVDYVGRLESLDEDIHHVLSTAPGLVAVGAAPSAAPAKNKSASTDAALYELLSSDAEVERRIYEAYKDDFVLFKYPRFDAATTPRPTAERTPDVAPIVAKGGARAPGGKPGKAGKGGGGKGQKDKGGTGDAEPGESPAKQGFFNKNKIGKFKDSAKFAAKLAARTAGIEAGKAAAPVASAPPPVEPAKKAGLKAAGKPGVKAEIEPEAAPDKKPGMKGGFKLKGAGMGVGKGLGKGPGQAAGVGNAAGSGKGAGKGQGEGRTLSAAKIEKLNRMIAGGKAAAK